MPIEILPMLLPALMVLAGFHGVLALEDPFRRGAAWVLLQSGLLAFLLLAPPPAPPGHPIWSALRFGVLGAGLLTAAALLSLARRIPKDLPAKGKRKGRG